MSDCTSLVVHSFANAFVDKLRLNERLFTFFDQTIKIFQRHKEDKKGGTTIGFGASVYDCSFLLSHFIENNCEVFHEKRVLEIGSGPGLASLIALLAGSKFVISSDGDYHSVALAEDNIKANILNHPRYVNKIKSVKLYWGNEDDECATKSFSREMYMKTVDVNNKNIDINSDGCFDIILASDVAALPYASAYNSLVNTLYNMCSRNKSSFVLLAYQVRISK
jgi:predicted nicotinamide N-methyase